jgi:hypothetical protein
MVSGGKGRLTACLIRGGKVRTDLHQAAAGEAATAGVSCETLDTPQPASPGDRTPCRSSSNY